MSLEPLPQPVLTAATLRRMAKEMILLAEALEAECIPKRSRKHHEFKHSKENRKMMKEIR